MTATSFLEGTTLMAVSTLAGGAIAWGVAQFRSRSEYRQKLLDEQEARINARTAELMSVSNERIAALEVVVNRLTDELSRLRNRVSNQVAAIHLLIGEVELNNPDATVLLRVERLLGAEFAQFALTPGFEIGGSEQRETP